MTYLWGAIKLLSRRRSHLSKTRLPHWKTYRRGRRHRRESNWTHLKICTACFHVTLIRRRIPLMTLLRVHFLRCRVYIQTIYKNRKDKNQAYVMESWYMKKYYYGKPSTPVCETWWNHPINLWYTPPPIHH